MVLSVLSLCGCSDSGSDSSSSMSEAENIAQKNSKGILGTWVVESLNKKETETLDEFAVSASSVLFFSEGTVVKFLSDGTFSTGGFNLEYKIVDDQFIYVYKQQNFSYDCKIENDTMILSTPDFVTITLKKNCCRSSFYIILFFSKIQDLFSYPRCSRLSLRIQRQYIRQIHSF